MFRGKLIAVAIGSSAIGLIASSVSLTSTASAAPRTQTASGVCGVAGTGTPTYKHVIVIMEENHSYNTIIGSGTGAPYINGLAKSCGLATTFHNISHPSLPNYIAITSATAIGGLSRFDSDCNPGGSCLSSSQSLFSQVATKGGWKSYEESMSSPCDGSSSGGYAPKHNPAVYYTDISSATCKASDVPLGTLSNSPLLKDFSSEASAPAFALVTPNLNDDMHDGSVSAGDTWLNKWMTKLTATTVYKANDTAIFIIWDEGEGGSYSSGENCTTHASDVSCHVAALVVAPSVPAGTSVSTTFTHYSFVRTVEELLGLPLLNQAKSAKSMVAAFKL